MSQHQSQKDMLFDVREDRFDLTTETVLDIFRNLKWVDVEWFSGDNAFLNSFIEVRLIRYICAEASDIRKHDDTVRAGRTDAVNQVFDVTGFGLNTNRLNDLVYLWNTFDKIMQIREPFNDGTLDQLMVKLMGGEVFVKKHVVKFREDLEWQQRVLSTLRIRSCEIEMKWLKGKAAQRRLGAVIMTTPKEYDAFMASLPVHKVKALGVETVQDGACRRLIAAFPMTGSSEPIYSSADGLADSLQTRCKLMAQACAGNREAFLEWIELVQGGGIRKEVDRRVTSARVRGFDRSKILERNAGAVLRARQTNTFETEEVIPGEFSDIQKIKMCEILKRQGFRNLPCAMQVIEKITSHMYWNGEWIHGDINEIAVALNLSADAVGHYRNRLKQLSTDVKREILDVILSEI